MMPVTVSRVDISSAECGETNFWRWAVSALSKTIIPEGDERDGRAEV